MKDNNTSRSSRRIEPLPPPGSYEFYLLMEGIKESQRRFDATPECRKLREDMKGRKSSEILRAMKELRQELEVERKFCEFDEETMDLLHQRAKDRIYVGLMNLPRGVYRMTDGTLIVGGNPEIAVDGENPSAAGA